MGEYLTIIWDAETPSAAEVPWDNCLLVVKGKEASLTDTTVYATTNDDWSTILAGAGFGVSSQAYKSTARFFSATPTPGSTLYILALVSGVVDIYENVPLQRITDYIYETPVKPPSGWSGTKEVRYYPDSSLTGYWVNKEDGSAGMAFNEVLDGAGDWNGQLDFLNGLSGHVIDVPPLVGSKVTASFTILSSTASLSETVETFGVNMMAVAYENSTTKKNYHGAKCYFGNQSADLMMFTNAIAGKNCILFYALPGDADIQTSGAGYSVYWDQLKNFIGAREDVALIKAKPSSSNHDMAAGYLGMTAGTHPHTTMTFAVPHMGIQEEESLIKRSYWNDGQIATPMTRRELTGNPYLISHGFTLGTGYSSRINYVRCKYIISQNLVNGLWALLASRTVRMSYAGMQLVRNKINGIFKTLQDQGIHDGLAYVRIPVEIDLKNNTSAGQDARAARTIPSIEIGFYWYSSLEKIIITGIRNEA